MQNPLIIPDYSKLKLTQLNEIYSRLDKANDPQKAEAIEAEIEKRNERLKKYPNIKNITGAYGDVRFAEFGVRFGAYLIDFFLFFIISIIFMTVILAGKIYAVIPVVIFIITYNLIFHAFFTVKFGGSPGKLLCRLKVIDKRGKYVNLRSSVLRIAPITIMTLLPLFSLSAIIESAGQGASEQEIFWNAYAHVIALTNILQYAWIIDYCWFFFNKDRRALHDLLSSSYVMADDNRAKLLAHIERLKETRTSALENFTEA